MTPTRIASSLLIFLFSASLLFHFLVLGNVIPYEMVWGGRIENREQLIGFEAFSIVSNILFLIILLLKARFLTWNVSPKAVKIGLWVILILFLLNTLGNLLSLNSTEKWIMTPLTTITVILTAILIFSKKQD
jgi:hypothetical protein